MDRTERLGLGMLNAGQLQKEVWINESLSLLDLLIGGQIVGVAAASPPENPEQSVWYRIETGALGAWSGQDGRIAVFIEGGWRFVTPFEGLELADRETAEKWRVVEGIWECGIDRVREVRVDGDRVLGPRGEAIADPTGGDVIDGESRAAIASILEAMRTHGMIA